MMKLFAIAFVALIGGINALPHADKEISLKEGRFVGDIVASALENLSQQLRDAGLDPWNFDRFGAGYELPVPTVFSVDGFVDDLQISGLSNIVINNINYGLLTSRLTLDISLPEVSIRIGNAKFNLKILGGEFSGSANCRLTVPEPRISGMIQLNIGIITGISVREIQLEFDMDPMRFDGSLILFGTEYADAVNNLVSYTIPNALANIRADMNELVTIIGWLIADMIL